MIKRILFSASEQEILNGETADIYFHRTKKILRDNDIVSQVKMEVFSKGSGILCGIEEAINLLKSLNKEISVYSKNDGDTFSPKEPVMRIVGDYTVFGIYETAILGILASSSGWATAARECLEEAGSSIPILSFGARHIHPAVSPVMDRSAIVSGCVGCSTPLGASLMGMKPNGTMPHALILIIGSTVNASILFNECIEEDVNRIVLVDTFRDEVEESIAVASYKKSNDIYGVRLDTPRERGGVTPELVHELRAKLDLSGNDEIKIFVSGGITPEKIKRFIDTKAPVDGFGIGSYISGATPIDFTADIKEVNGRIIAKRGRLPGITSQNLGKKL